MLNWFLKKLIQKFGLRIARWSITKYYEASD